MSKVHRILFVCTGNTCRSPMAEGLLKKALAAAGRRDIEVTSAGIAALTGAPPTEETLQVMGEEGVDLAEHRATDVTEEIIRDADLILTMEHVHKLEVLRRVPDAAPRTFLLKEYASAEKIADPEMYGIQDPIGWGTDYYRHTLGVIKREIERILPAL